MPDQNSIRRLTFQNQLDELEKIHLAASEIVEQWNLPAHLGFTLDLVLEEAFTNIVLYAYNDKDQHEIIIEFENTGDTLLITLVDDGQPYDPTKKDDPDITAPISEREVGGLGIFLIRKMMDDVRYERISNKNVLKLTKNYANEN